MSYIQILEQYEGIEEKVITGSVEHKMYQKEIKHPDFVVLDNLYKLQVASIGGKTAFVLSFSTKYKKQNFYLISESIEETFDRKNKPEKYYQFHFSQTTAVGKNSVDSGFSTEDPLMVPKHDFIHVALALIENERNKLNI